MTATGQSPAPPAGGVPFTSSSFLPRGSAGLKLILVCGLALLMAIPALFVYGVVQERTQGARQALADVSQGVGGPQSVMGPVLALPYARAPDPDKPDRIVYGIAIAYAETGEITANVEVGERSRGIYLVPVFEGRFDIAARFDPAALRDAVPADATPVWEDARLYVGLTDTRGIRETIAMTANGTVLVPEPATHRSTSNSNYDPVPEAGLALAGAPVPGLEALDVPLNIRVAMRVSGAERLSLPPFAKDTRLTMTSNWDDPSFVGGMLPSRHTAGETEGAGFTAEWRVPYLARNIPGAGARLSLTDLTAWDVRDMGVRFMREANPYQSVERALKYAAMFIGFVFLAYFLFEVTSGARAHPAQYVLIGLAQSIFYLLLLAFAERMGFDLAFLIAAAMTVGLISLYTVSVFRSLGYGLRALLVLSGIYGLIYILMRAEGEALLAGAIASFLAIAVTMFMTRNVDWYGKRAAA